MPLILRALAFLAALLTPAAALAQCVGAPVTAARFGLDLDGVEATVKKGDLDNLDVSMAEIALAVPCLSEVVATKDAARLHLLSAIQADPLGSDPTNPTVVDGLARYKELLPKQPLPKGLLPPDNGVRKQFEKMSAVIPKVVRVPKPRVGHVVFDGITTRDRPADEPALFQLVGEGGKVQVSANLLPKDPLPKYDAVLRTRNTLWAGAGGCLLASAASFAGAWVVRSQFNKVDPNYTTQILTHKAHVTNALVVVSATFGAAAVGLGATGFTVHR